MALTDVRLSVLDTVNEARRKLGVPNAISLLTADSQSVVAVDWLNDVVAEINDFGFWPDMVATATTAMVAGQNVYSINTTDPVKTVKDIYYGPNRVRMNFITVEEMRLLERVRVDGEPRRFTIQGLDALANPNIRVSPIPTTTESLAGDTIDVLYQKMAPRYVADVPSASLIIPFPSRLVVQGLMTRMILDEEGGSPSDHYSLERATFEKMMKDQFARFKGDVGYFRRMVPVSARYAKR